MGLQLLRYRFDTALSCRQDECVSVPDLDDKGGIERVRFSCLDDSAGLVVPAQAGPGSRTSSL